jgi:hypothetical protein
VSDPGLVLGIVLLAATLGVIAVIAAPKILPTVAQDERMVVFRAGRTSASVRGPGRHFLVPRLDSGALVSLAPQRLVLEPIPVRTRDGGGVMVEVEASYRVVNPLLFASTLISPDAVGVRLLAAKLLQDATEGLDATDAQDPGRLEQAIEREFEDALARAGATDQRVRVLHARPAVITESETLAATMRLGPRGLEPDPDYAGPRTFVGDLRWGVGRIRRMASYGLFAVLLSVGAVLVLTPFGEPSLSASNVMTGIVFGILAGFVVTAPPRWVDPRLGYRRWFLVILGWFGWTTAELGALLTLAAAIGLL